MFHYVKFCHHLPAVYVIRPLNGAPLLFIAQLFLLSSQFFTLSEDPFLLAPPLILYTHPLPLQELTLHAVRIKALLLSL